MKTLDQIFEDAGKDVKKPMQQNALNLVNWLFMEDGEGCTMPERWVKVRELVYMTFEHEIAEASKNDFENIRMMDELMAFCQKHRELVLSSGRKQEYLTIN